MEIGERFGRNVAAQRMKAGLTQEELADRADMHRTEVSLIENGGRKPRLETILKLAGTLGIPTETLLAGLAWIPPPPRPRPLPISHPTD
jgi:transcriptional regulator with XRE-family HTH domain